VGIQVEFKGGKFHIPEMDVIVHKIQGHGAVIGIEYRSPRLHGHCPFELIGRNLFGNIDHQIAFDPLLHGIDVVGPYPVVHEFINGILHGLEHLLVGTLNLLTDYLHIAPELLCGSSCHHPEESN
jgi:hypothetical protein